MSRRNDPEKSSVRNRPPANEVYSRRRRLQVSSEGGGGGFNARLQHVEGRRCAQETTSGGLQCLKTCILFPNQQGGVSVIQSLLYLRLK